MSMFSKIIKHIKIWIANNDSYIDILRSQGVIIGKGCVVDKRAEFGTEPYLICLSDYVRVTQGVKFITHDGGLWVPRRLKLVNNNADLIGKIVVGKNTNIGWNAIIMPGVTIGDNCIIGCGSVVTKNVPDNSVVAGVPAKVIESIEEYVNKNKSYLVETKHLSYEEKKKWICKNMLKED